MNISMTYDKPRNGKSYFGQMLNKDLINKFKVGDKVTIKYDTKIKFNNGKVVFVHDIIDIKPMIEYDDDWFNIEI